MKGKRGDGKEKGQVGKEGKRGSVGEQDGTREKMGKRKMNKVSGTKKWEEKVRGGEEVGKKGE